MCKVYKENFTRVNSLEKNQKENLKVLKNGRQTKTRKIKTGGTV
jgi:hypothetical protein